MAILKSFNDIVISMLDYLRQVQPSLDVKPNSVARDLFIDAQARQMANIYTELRAQYPLFWIASCTPIISGWPSYRQSGLW